MDCNFLKQGINGYTETSSTAEAVSHNVSVEVVAGHGVLDGIGSVYAYCRSVFCCNILPVLNAEQNCMRYVIVVCEANGDDGSLLKKLNMTVRL